MKNKMFAITLTVLITLAGFGAVSYINQPAWAGINSLPTRAIKSTDNILIHDSLGNNYAVNWSDFQRMSTQAVNWYYISTSTGATNWNSNTPYIGN